MKESAEGEASKFVPSFPETGVFNPTASGGGGNAENAIPSAESKSNDILQALEEANRVAKEILMKEDDDFEKLEAMFIESLGLGSAEILKR